ncbi:MAG: FG-GAP repeat domain-containing protein [Myxococcota bacterium]
MLSSLLLLLACTPDNRLNPTKPGGGGTDDTGGDGPTTDTGPFPNQLGEFCNGEDDDGDGVTDEGWADANANGLADCLEAECPALDVGVTDVATVSAACVAMGADPDLPLTDAWSARVKWQVDAPDEDPEAVWSYSQPVAGNLDDDNGDGVIDEEDTPEVVAVFMMPDLDGDADDRTHAWIVAMDGATGDQRWAREGALPTGSAIIADVDADGSPDVVGFDDEGRPIALEGTGRLKWHATDAPTAASLYPLMSVADLDGDGRPEVIADDLVLDGVDGDTEFWIGGGVPLSAPYRIAAVADVDLDGDQEIAMAGALYDSDGSEIWDAGEEGGYGLWPVILQADDDDEAEVGFVGQRWSLFEHDGDVIYSVSYASRNPNQPGPPCAGDFDRDGLAEVVWPAYDEIVMYELDGTAVWSASIDDSSGLSGCSGYDVDGNGALEVLYADQYAFRILAGADGSALYANGNHRSGTVFEYPTVADVDHDDHADILIAGSVWDYNTDTVWAAVTVFEHDGDGWPSAGATWAVHDFAVTNVDPSGRVPASPEPSWTTYNVYRARPADDAQSPPDLTVAFTDACVADCTYGPARVAIQVANVGDETVPAGAWLTLYANDGGTLRYLNRWGLPAIPARTKLDGVEIQLLVEDVGTDGWVVSVDDDGTGRGSVEECDEENNRDEWADVSCP